MADYKVNFSITEADGVTPVNDPVTSLPIAFSFDFKPSALAAIHQWMATIVPGKYPTCAEIAREALFEKFKAIAGPQIAANFAAQKKLREDAEEAAFWACFNLTPPE